MRNRSSGYLLAGIVSTIGLLIFFAIEIVIAVKFSIDVSDRLKRAGDANTVSIAIKELEAVISHLEEEKITEGYTSVIYNTPDEDIKFWYLNLKSSLNELKMLLR